MGHYKELYLEAEEKFGNVVRAEREKNPMALWLLFEYFEWRLKQEKEFHNASTKRDDKKDNPATDDKSRSDEDEQFTFGNRERLEQ